MKPRKMNNQDALELSGKVKESKSDSLKLPFFVSGVGKSLICSNKQL